MKKYILMTIVLVFCVQVNADQFCSGQVKSVWLDAYGNLYIKGTWRNDHTQICNVNTAWNGVVTPTCEGWLSLSLTAQTTQGGVILRYPDSIGSCNAIPTYTASPKPDYIMLDR